MELVGSPACSGMGDQDLHWLRLEIVSLACLYGLVMRVLVFHNVGGLLM